MRINSLKSKYNLKKHFLVRCVNFERELSLLKDHTYSNPKHIWDSMNFIFAMYF